RKPLHSDCILRMRVFFPPSSSVLVWQGRPATERRGNTAACGLQHDCMLCRRLTCRDSMVLGPTTNFLARIVEFLRFSEKLGVAILSLRHTLSRFVFLNGELHPVTFISCEGILCYKSLNQD